MVKMTFVMFWFVYQNVMCFGMIFVVIEKIDEEVRADESLYFYQKNKD